MIELRAVEKEGNWKKTRRKLEENWKKKLKIRSKQKHQPTPAGGTRRSSQAEQQIKSNKIKSS